MSNKIVAVARQAGVAFLLACAGHAAAAVQMLLPPSASTKAMPTPPADVRSTAHAVHFNAEELFSLPLGSEVELTLPDATKHTFVFDQKRDSGNGIVSWVGYYRDQDQRYRLNAIITVGPSGSVGLIQTPHGGELRIIPGAGGNDWLVDLKAERQLQPKRERGNDSRPAPTPVMSKLLQAGASPDFAAIAPGTSVPASSPLAGLKAATLSTVDIMIVYNDSLATALGANLQTFLQNLIVSANTAYSNSGIAMQLRLVDTFRVTYSDAVTDDVALDDITNNAGVFAGIEARRTQVGADVVHFYRGGTSGFQGSGLAWVPTSPITDTTWSPYMYSTMNGCWQGCQAEIFVHEVGHNMGNKHDRATTGWETNGAAQDTGTNRGAYDYSWGFYTCNGKYDASVLSCNPFVAGGCANQGEPECTSTTGAYRDLMAYFGNSTQLSFIFSNPSLVCDPGVSTLQCGLAQGFMDLGTRSASANAALSMNNNAVGLSAMKATMSGGGTGTPTTTTIVSSYNPAQVGSSLGFTANVTSGSGTPAGGTMTFRYNGNAISGCTGINVASGQSFCIATGLPAGTLSITAQYTGAGGFADSTSAVLTQVMVPVPRVVPTPPRKVDFDNDGKGDLGWRGPNGLWGAWLMAGASYSPTGTALVTPPQAGSTMHALADFNGDGRTDILWRNPDNSYSVTLMSGTTQGAPIVVRGPNSGFDVLGVGDFNGDGTADLLWAGLNGQYQVTLMSGGAPAAPVVLPPPAAPFFPAFIGDFSGEGRDDILWRSADGTLIIMLMNGTASAGLGQLIGANSGWYPTHLADFNGDGKTDILLAKGDGSVAMWLISGAAIVGGAVLQDTHGVPNGWSVALARDLDGDRRADLIWANTDGTYGGWLMNGTAVKPNGYGSILNVPNSGWSIVASGDYNADGKADLMWKHTDGRFSTWIMNGFSATAYGAVLGAGTGWDLAP